MLFLLLPFVQHYCGIILECLLFLDVFVVAAVVVVDFLLPLNRLCFHNAWVELLLLLLQLLLTDTGSGRARRELSSSSPSSAALFGDIGLFWAHVSRMMMHRCCLSGLLFCNLCSRELRRQFWVGLLMVFFLEGVKTAPVVRCSKWSVRLLNDSIWISLPTPLAR